MPSRFAQFGGVQGAADTLQQMVAARIQQQMEDEKRAIEAYKLQQQDRQIGQGDARIGLDRERLEHDKQPKPQNPVTLSPGARLVSPSDGRLIAEAPERPEKPAGPMNLGPGSVIADPESGRIIVRNPQQAARSAEDDLHLFEQKEKIKAQYGGSRPSLGAERTALGFYNRAQQASKDIEPIEPNIAKAGLLEQGQLQYAHNALQTSEQKSYRQAQRAFTEARLRKESGAAIPTAEYENDAKTYFAVPGDDETIIAQKRAARQVVLDGLKFQSGKAYEEYYGQPNQSPPQQQQAAPKVGDVKTFPNGRKGVWDGKGWVARP